MRFWCRCFPCCGKSEAKSKNNEADSRLELSTEQGDPNKRQPLTDFFDPKELAVLGTLASRVKVIIDATLPPTLHGTSRVAEGVPLAIVNERAPDRRYVILHEAMHHQLDEIGCPSLCCSLAGKEPPGSWLLHTAFPKFVRGLLVQLWELIQHSRFNSMLSRVFQCGPQSARNMEYMSYISNKRIPMYGMCGSDGHPSLHRVVVAAHIATVSMEASEEVCTKFITFVRQRFQMGDSMVRNSDWCSQKKAL